MKKIIIFLSMVLPAVASASTYDECVYRFLDAMCPLVEDRLAPNDMRKEGASFCFVGLEVIPDNYTKIRKNIKSIIDKSLIKASDNAEMIESVKECISSPEKFNTCDLVTFNALRMKKLGCK